MRTCSCRLGLGAISGLMLALAASPAGAQSLWRFEYATQINCSLANQDAALAEGFYKTLIDIHNPVASANAVRWKIAPAVPVTGAVTGGPVSNFADFNLGSDRAVRIECPAIRTRLAANGITPSAVITGFVVIQSRFPLDVVALYTGAGFAAPAGGPVSVMHGERVPGREIH